MEAVEQETQTPETGGAKKQRKQRDGGLRDVANVPEEIAAFGRTYRIRKFTLGQAAEALQYIGPFSYVLRYLMAFPKDGAGRPMMTQEDGMELAVRALSISGESFLGLISVATGEPLEWLREQEDPLDGLEIFAAAVEKNAPLFSAQSVERASRLFGRLKSAIPALGGTQ